jgi:hypothetical protein
VWAALTQATHERACYWDALAGRLQRLDGWTFEES